MGFGVRFGLRPCEERSWLAETRAPIAGPDR
jgi:hypothetical protein